MAQHPKKTILVTGALGHIGSRLVREFSPALVGRVIMLDNLSTQRYASLFDLPRTIDYAFYEDDIRTADLNTHLAGVDVVVHLAAITDAPSSKDTPEETFDVNLKGTIRLAEACRANGIPLLFPSTTSVYGTQAELVDETSSELKPQSPYADSKLQAEKYLQSQKQAGLKFVICRFGTIFGWSVGMRFHTAVNKFTWQAIHGLPITVWKTAWEQKRPYLYLGDCVEAINLILEKNVFDGEIYNVLTTNSAVKDIVETIRQFAPDVKVSYVDSAIMNQLSYEVSDNKFRARGFFSKGRLKDGIQETFSHFSYKA